MTDPILALRSGQLFFFIFHTSSDTISIIGQIYDSVLTNVAKFHKDVKFEIAIWS